MKFQHEEVDEIRLLYALNKREQAEIDQKGSKREENLRFHLTR